jgi:hypothetical protein
MEFIGAADEPQFTGIVAAQCWNGGGPGRNRPKTRDLTKEQRN